MKRKIDCLDILIVLMTVGCLILLCCPYEAWRSVGDHLAADGSMERLTESFLNGIRLFVSMVTAICIGLRIWHRWQLRSYADFWHSVARLPGRTLQDFRPFLADLVGAFRMSAPEAILLGGIIISGTVLRLLQLNVPLEHDEAYSMAIWGRENLWFAVSDYHLPNNHIFHSVLLNLIYHGIGKTPALLRQPAFLSGCLMIPVLWLLGRMLFNSRVGLVAAGFAAFAPYLVYYSVNARGYTMMALFSLVAMGLTVYGKRKGNLFAWVLLIIISALNFWTLPIALYPFGGICIWLFLNVLFWEPDHAFTRNRWKLFKYLIAMGLSVSFLTAVLYLPVITQSGWNSLFGNVFVQGLAPDIFGETMVSRMIDTFHALTDGVPVTVLFFMGVGIAVSVFFFHSVARENIPVLGSVLLWMLLVVPIQKPNLWPRTLAFLHPFLYLAAAAGLYALFVKFQRPNLGSVLSVLLVMILGVTQFMRLSPDIHQPGATEQAIQMILNREGDNADSVYLITAAEDNAPLWMYADLYGIDGGIFDKTRAFNTVYAFVDPKNKADFEPQDLETLLTYYSPGAEFFDESTCETLISHPYGILYRYEGRESAIRKAYGTYPEIQ